MDTAKTLVEIKHRRVTEVGGAKEMEVNQERKDRPSTESCRDSLPKHTKCNYPNKNRRPYVADQLAG